MIVTVLAVAWVAAEIVLQMRQWARGGQGSSWEWSSFVVLVVVGVVAGVASPRVADALPWPGPSPVLLAVGVVVAVAGIGLRLWSIVALGRFFRGVVNVQADQYVVRTGPYRFVRHPAYAGALVGVAGLMVTTCSAAALLFVLVLVGPAVAYRIRVEERLLRRALGASYEQYATETARLVPRVW